MLRRLINGLTDLVYPKTCAVCKTGLKGKTCIDDAVCGACWEKIKKNTPPFCHRCGRHLDKPLKNICPACVRKQLHFDRAFSPCVYDGALKELILDFKYRNKEHLGRLLSRLMSEFIREYRLPMDFIDLLIPVPLHKARMRQREFNQAEVLSGNIAGEFRKTMMNNVLIRNRNTPTQTELEHSERLQNVKGSFSVTDKEAIKAKNILLIDDVLTTGATSSEAALALKDAGTGVVFVLTLAN